MRQACFLELAEALGTMSVSKGLSEPRIRVGRKSAWSSRAADRVWSVLGYLPEGRWKTPPLDNPNLGNGSTLQWQAKRVHERIGINLGAIRPCSHIAQARPKTGGLFVFSKVIAGHEFAAETMETTVLHGSCWGAVAEFFQTVSRPDAPQISR